MDTFSDKYFFQSVAWLFIFLVVFSDERTNMVLSTSDCIKCCISVNFINLKHFMLDSKLPILQMKKWSLREVK